MTNFRSLAIAAFGLVILAAAAAFTLSMTLAFATILSLTLAARMISAKLRRAPVPVRARTDAKASMRVWNDGRGTIIDL